MFIRKSIYKLHLTLLDNHIKKHLILRLVLPLNSFQLNLYAIVIELKIFDIVIHIIIIVLFTIVCSDHSIINYPVVDQLLMSELLLQQNFLFRWKHIYHLKGIYIIFYVSYNIYVY